VTSIFNAMPSIVAKEGPSTILSDKLVTSSPTDTGADTTEDPAIKTILLFSPNCNGIGARTAAAAAAAVGGDGWVSTGAGADPPPHDPSSSVVTSSPNRPQLTEE